MVNELFTRSLNVLILLLLLISQLPVVVVNSYGALDSMDSAIATGVDKQSINGTDHTVSSIDPYGEKLVKESMLRALESNFTENTVDRLGGSATFLNDYSEAVAGEPTSYGVLNIRVVSPEGPLSDVSITAHIQHCGLEWCDWINYGYNTTDENGYAKLYLPPGLYRLSLWGKARGSLYNVSVNAYETKDLVIEVGRVLLNIYDLNGELIDDATIIVYEQVNFINNTYMPGRDVLYTWSNPVDKYLVSGTYAVEVYLGWPRNPIFYNVRVDAMKNNTYDLRVNAVPVHLYYDAPSTTQYIKLYVNIYATLTPYEFTTTWVGEYGKTVYLPPGRYYYVIEYIDIGWGSIYYSKRGEFTVETGIYNEVCLLEMGRVVFKPSNYPDAETQPVRVVFEHVLYNNSEPYHTQMYGYTYMGYNDSITLPPGSYYAYVEIGDETVGSQYFNVSLSSDTVLNMELNVGFLNLTTVFQDRLVSKYFGVFRLVSGYYMGVGSGYTGSLIPLPPGTYKAEIYYIGYNYSVVENIVIEKNKVYNVSIELSKLIVHLTFPDRLERSIPIYVIPVVNNTLQTSYKYVVYKYTYGDYAEFYVSPGTYAVIIPGTNTTQYYETYMYVGYGVAELNVTLKPNTVAERSYGLGKIRVEIEVPKPVLKVETPYEVVVATQKYVNGTPVIDKIVDYSTIWRYESVFDLTPGVYAVFLRLGETILNDTITYNVVVEPNETTTITYNAVYVTLNITLICGEPMRGSEIYVSIDGESYIGLGKTDDNGLLTVALPKGTYSIYWSYRINWKRIYKYIADINVTGSGHQIFNITVERGLLKIKALGPNNEPLPGMRFPIYWFFYIGSIITDENGYGEKIVPLDATLRIKMPIETRDDHEIYVKVEEEEGGVVYLVLKFNVVKITFNADPAITNMSSDIYVKIIVYDIDTNIYETIYLPLTDPLNQYLYLLPGNYSIILPGRNTVVEGYYGYGEEENITLNGNNTLTEIVFNLTYISIAFNATIGMVSTNAELYSINDAGELVDWITYGTIYGPSYVKTFLVTPGRYGLYLPNGAPDGKPIVFTNISVDVDHPWTYIYAPGALCVNIKSSVELSENFHLWIELYYWDDEEGWVHFKYAWLNYGSYLTRALTSNTLYKIEAYYYNRLLYSEVFYIEPGRYRLIGVRVTGVLVRLTGPDNEPLVNARVKLYNATSDSYIGGGYTDDEGRVFFVVPHGEYKVVLPGMNHPSYDPDIRVNGSFGYGGEYYVNFSTGEVLVYNITLARIDFRVVSPSGPAPGVQASLYDLTHNTPLKGGLTSGDGYVRFYVTPGNYTVVIRGLNYGWGDYYKLGLNRYKANGYGDYVNLTVDSIGVYTYTYRISELIVNATRINGTGIPGLDIYLYSESDEYIHGTSTNGDGLATIYLTPGTYEASILEKTYSVTLGEFDSYKLNITLAEVIIRINTPVYEELVDQGMLENLPIYIYKDYSGYGTGTQLKWLYTDKYGVARAYLFYNETYQIVLPGFNTTRSSYGLGYGEYVNVAVTSDLTIVFNLSVIIAYIDGPEGPVNGVEVDCGSIYSYYSLYRDTYGGYAYFIVTSGRYYVDLKHVLGVEKRYVDVAEYSVVWYNETLSVIHIIQVNPLLESGEASSIKIYIDSLNTSETDYVYVYDHERVYVGNGTYLVRNSEYNGHVYQYTVCIGVNETREVVFETRNLYIYIYGPNGELVNDQWFSVKLYTQEGVGENATLGHYVDTDYDRGYFEFKSITPGLYAVKFSKGHERIIYDINVTLEEDEIAVSTTIGALIIKLYSDGEPAVDHYVKLYTSSAGGGVDEYVGYRYTDENGEALFYVTGGWYAVYISGVGYLYGLYVRDGECFVYEYSLEQSDLSVENISWSPEIIVENSTALFRVSITNYGPAPVYRDFNVSFYLNNTLVYEAVVYGLNANSSKIVEAPIFINESGIYELRIVVDEINAVYDNNRGNNVKTIYFTVAKRTDIVELVKPSPYTYVENAVDVEGLIAPGKRVNITIYVNHTLYLEAYNLTNNFTSTIDLSSYPDSPIEISVLAVTVDGREADYEEVIIYLDKTPPYITVVSPSNNTYVPSMFNVTVYADDPYYGLPGYPTIFINGSSYAMNKLSDNLYYFTVEATSYADGSVFNITVYVVDYSGKEACSTIYVTLDKTPPVTTHNSTRTWYNRDVVIVLSPSDNLSGVNTTYYRVDGGEWLEGTVVYVPAPSDHSNDGLHVIEFYSIDNAGNVEEVKNLTIGIDTGLPEITSTLENNTYFSTGRVNVTLYLSDQLSGLQSYTVYLDSFLIANETLSGVGNYTVELPELVLDDLDEGLHVYRVVVVDMAGNTRVSEIRFYIDRTPPIAEIIYPMNGSLLCGVVDIVFNYSDNIGVSEAYLLIDDSVINVNGAYSYSLDTTGYPDGLLTITLKVVDRAGLTTNVSIAVYIDNTPPTTVIIEPANYTYVSGYLTIVFNVSDEHLEQALLYIDGLVFNVLNETSLTIDTRSLEDGVYTVMLYANDTLGHYSYSTIYVVVDNTPPTAEIVSPKNNSFVPAVFTVELLYSDDNLEAAYLTITGTTFTTTYNVTSMYSYVIDAGALDLVDGEYTLTLYVEDRAGNTASYTITIYLDTAPPTLEITGPANMSLVNGNVTITFNYGDDHLANATLIIGGEEIDVTGTYSYVLDTTLYTDGDYTVTLKACDLSGNCVEESIVLTIDNTPPIINLLTPEDQQVFYLNETINISWEITEPHLSMVKLYIDDEEIDVTGRTSYSINASQLGEGIHTIKIKAVDQLNQSSEVNIAIDITTPPTPQPTTTPPSTSTPSPTPSTTPSRTPTKTTPAAEISSVTVAAIIIAIIVIAVALVFLFKKK